jgi:hypothetical protein
MLDPSDSRQRNTLVDLVWLLVVLYFLYSFTGFRGCQPRPAAPWNELQQEEQKKDRWEEKTFDGR